MIVVGVILIGLLLLAFAGRALGDESESSGGWDCVLFLALLLGLVLRKRKERQDEDY